MQVTATEAKNRFGYYCAQAKSEPVVVEKDGRPDTVLVDFKAYSQLKAAAERGAGRPKADELYAQYKDWFDVQDELIEKHGIPGEEHRPW